MISLIVAASDNHIIGKGNQLLWKLPKDFERMKKLTMAHPLVMGRKTHESIGRALPGRTNIVITRSEQAFEGCVVAHSLTEALDVASRSPGSEEIFIFGGGEVYREAMHTADRIYMTRIHTQAQGDTVFPVIDPKEWKETAREDHSSDQAHPYPFSFITYSRVR